jgi:hypothetical protein
MRTSQTQFLNELAAGHDGPPIPPAKRAYFQERLRGRMFDFLLGRFLTEKENGLNQAKLARRIGKPPEVINRWLGSPGNLTLDTISDLLIGIRAEELDFLPSPLLHRAPVNYSHFDQLVISDANQDHPQTATKLAVTTVPQRNRAHREPYELGRISPRTEAALGAAASMIEPELRR